MRTVARLLSGVALRLAVVAWGSRPRIGSIGHFLSVVQREQCSDNLAAWHGRSRVMAAARISYSLSSVEDGLL